MRNLQLFNLHRIIRFWVRLWDESYNFLYVFTVESGDEILAKYRKKPTTVSSIANEPQVSAHSGAPVTEIESGAAVNEDTQYLFADTKRKLRLVLSMVDFTTTLWSSPLSGKQMRIDLKLLI